MKNKPNKGEKMTGASRRFGKSFQKEKFEALSKAGESIEYHHPDYVCLSRKRWEEYQKAHHGISQKIYLDECIKLPKDSK